MPQSYASMNCHIVFATKKRSPRIRREFRYRLHAYIGGIVRERDCTLRIAGGTANHVHLLVSVNPNVRIADLVRDIKAISSRWIRENWDGDFGWQRGYGVFSVYYRAIPKVRNYIANQEAHHRRHSLESEYTRLLDAHEMPRDERRMWA